MPEESEPIVKEFFVRGSVPMLLTALQNFVDERGYGLDSPKPPTEVSAHLASLLPKGLQAFEFGYVRLSAVPGDQVQVYLSNEASWAPPKKVDLENKEFNRFYRDLLPELTRLGFIVSPEERPPIGFVKEDEP